MGIKKEPVMKTINDYLDAVKQRKNLSSDAQIAPLLKVSTQAISAFRKNKSRPSETTMLTLASLAGISKEQALLELSYWSTDDEATQKVYKGLIDKVSGVLTVLIIVFAGLLFFENTAEAASFYGAEHITAHNPEIYIITQKAKTRLRKMRRWFQRFLTPSLYPLAV